ncbi:MAG: iron export ABC transporter permease subunit FetB [Actinobacteria bacterium]|nr:iron export ABC transporter permease subunit FetB [Actinomycetota bacterium]MCG2807948.1 iron export ABC transporter permease subunit FetB [Coriobacteriia bacterium]
MPETTAGGVIAISWLQLAMATGFVVFVGILSMRLALGIEKDLAIATVRTYIQLIVLGLVLRWVFGIDSPWIVLAILALMMAAAAQTIVKRAPDAPRGILGSSMLTMLLTGFTVTFAVTGLIVQVDPWYRAQYVIPIAGMVLGNSMNGVALALERTFADMDTHAEEILALVALGASPWEASGDIVRVAIRAGLIPTINSMAAAGLVFIPGMMTGQVLAGADPLHAAYYQIVVMLMVSAATALGSVMAVLLSFRRRFSADGVYLEKGYRT